MFDLATELSSPMDRRMFDKCNGSEVAVGYKARFSFEEMKYVFSDDVQSRLGIKVIILSRNPVKQALSAFRRDFEHHDQRNFNMLLHAAEHSCKNKSLTDAICLNRVIRFKDTFV